MIDTFTGLIAGWECSLRKETTPVEPAIRHATAFHTRQDHPLTGDTTHHPDTDSHHTAAHFDETLIPAGLTPPIDTAGNALNNALTDTTTALYKTACIHEDSPLQHGPLTTLTHLEAITPT